MARHSKNACSSAIYSNRERSLLFQTTSSNSAQPGTKQRATDNSVEFDTCYLCLSTPAHEPTVVCDHGHVSCKECAVLYILNQKKMQKEKHLKQVEEAIIKEQMREEKSEKNRLRAEDDFIRQQSSNLSSSFNEGKRENKLQDSDRKVISLIDSPHGLVILCGKEPHPISLKSLYLVRLSRSCPSCCKSFLSIGPSILSLIPCGHVLCRECKDMCVDCPSCEASVSKIIEIYLRK